MKAACRSPCELKQKADENSETIAMQYALMIYEAPDDFARRTRPEAESCGANRTGRDRLAR